MVLFPRESVDELLMVSSGEDISGVLELCDEETQKLLLIDGKI